MTCMRTTSFPHQENNQALAQLCLTEILMVLLQLRLYSVWGK